MPDAVGSLKGAIGLPPRRRHGLTYDSAAGLGASLSSSILTYILQIKQNEGDFPRLAEPGYQRWLRSDRPALDSDDEIP